MTCFLIIEDLKEIARAMCQRSSMNKYFYLILIQIRTILRLQATKCESLLPYNICISISESNEWRRKTSHSRNINKITHINKFHISLRKIYLSTKCDHYLKYIEGKESNASRREQTQRFRSNALAFVCYREKDIHLFAPEILQQLIVNIWCTGS